MKRKKRRRLQKKRIPSPLVSFNLEDLLTPPLSQNNVNEAHLNINGLRNKLPELELFTSTYHPSIILLSEIRYPPNCIAPQLKDYETIFLPHPSGSCGLTCFVRLSLNFRFVPSLSLLPQEPNMYNRNPASRQRTTPNHLRLSPSRIYHYARYTLIHPPATYCRLLPTPSTSRRLQCTPPILLTWHICSSWTKVVQLP